MFSRAQPLTRAIARGFCTSAKVTNIS
ncbi:unnamed protein product [Darwinula stevensoni]|uniref:Uncharacterized protein n=1 Tax=Darwinula stevensoni TaxID=69355 RepID=A0A7R8ZYX8_9CRUS|nr:unnamed protein product [Darwinula stevensoni]CAG0882405.1 unnamed protein product [Darwinula stevensoni]